MCRDADEFTKKSLHGLAEEIRCRKSAIKLKDILKPGVDGTVPRCVLVEGPQGIGKSTLAWELCQKWEELDSIKQYELVVLVNLREKKAQKARCLEDLLLCDARTDMKKLLAAIGRGKGVLIVCDGFDELPRAQRQESSVYMDLIRGMLLPEATVILTSRPSVSTDLEDNKRKIDRHFEIMGFSKEDIKRFAETIFSGDILASFLSYITSNPPIHSMMYIPLNAIIVALTFLDSYDTNTSFPTTMTQLFDALSRALLRRHLMSTHQFASDFCVPPSLQCTEDIRKLPSLVAQQLIQLAKIAYEGFKKKRYVFTDLGEDFEHLGLLNKTACLNACASPGCSYSFLHPMLQEYFTALYIVIASPSGFELDDWLDERTIVRFLAGIFGYCDYSSHPVYQELVQEISRNCNSWRYETQRLVHCAFECPSIMESIKVDYSISETIEVQPFVDIDWYVTGYCISHFDERWKLVCQGACVREKSIDLLVMGLRSSTVAKGRIASLYTEFPSFSAIIPPLINFCQLYSLELYSVNINHDSAVIVQQLIAPGSGLKKFTYCNGGIGHCTDKFLPLLFQQSSVEELYLQCDQITGLLFPSKNTNLKKLEITREVLYPPAMPLLKITSLTYLQVDEPMDRDLAVLAGIVQSHRSLKVLKIRSYRNYDAYSDDSVNSLTNSPDNLIQLIETASSSRLQKLLLQEKLYDMLPCITHHPG